MGQFSHLDDFNTGGPGATNHVSGSASAWEFHHELRSAFLKHLLVADGAGLPAELSPIRVIDSRR
jgi:hypothetical protein